MTVPARLVPLAAAALLAGCGEGGAFEALTRCAACGEVRSVTPHALRSDIHLHTDAPSAWAVNAAAGAARRVVYLVRVRMDRGGSRDFLLNEAGGLHAGDRVRIRNGVPVELAGSPGWS